MMRKRITSLLLCFVLALSLLPTAAFAEGTTQSGTATLIGFAAGRKAGDAYIQNNGMTILDATGTDGNNPMYYSESKVGQPAILSPYCPPYGMTMHPKYVYNDYNATSIIVQNPDESGTQRRLLKDDTFKAGMTYRFTFQDTSWPVTSIIKGGGYLGELDASNFTISGASVVRVKRVAQRISATEDYEMQGFFYNVWIKINGTQNDYKVQYADNNVTVAGLSRTDSSTTPAKTGYAKEGDRITLTAAKIKEGYFFTGWKFTTTGDNKFYMDKDYIQWYCNVTDYAINESGSDKVTCSFRMGDKNLKVEALYGRPGAAGVGNVTFSNVKLWVMSPVKGAKGVAAAVPEFDVLGTTYQIGKVEWLEDNETGAPNYLGMDSSKAFDTANKCYTMRVVLKLNNGYAFSDRNGVTITINDKTYSTGTENPLYNRENRTMPVTYNYNEASKSLAIYIPAGGDRVKTRLEDRYKAYAALDFVDAPSIEVTVTRPGSGNLECGSATTSGFTMELEQGINYSVNVKVKVPQAIQTAIEKGLVRLLPQFQYLMKDTDMGTNLWRSSQVTDSKDGSDTIYTYSTNFAPEAGQKYMLVFGSNLVTTGADAQRIAGNIISGTFNCVNTKITDGPTVTGSALKAGAASGPVLTTSSTQYYIDTSNTTAWDIPDTGAENGKTYWTMLCLRPKSGYVFDPGHDYKPDVKLGGAAAKTNYAVAVDGSAMFLTIYATATHEHVMGFVDNGKGCHIYKCTVPGCYSYNGYKEAHIWGEEGTVSGSSITYTCKKCPATRTEDYTAPDEGVTTIYCFYAKVTTPKDGDTVGNAPDWLEMRNTANGKVQVVSAAWQDEHGAAVTTFEASKTYTITVTFEAAAGYKINESDSDVLLNSDGTAGERKNNAENRTVTQSMSFTVKRPVDVKITLPNLKVGEQPSLPTFQSDEGAVKAVTCMVSVNGILYIYSGDEWDKERPTLKADDVVTYAYALTPNDGYEFAITTIVTNTAANLTDHFDGNGGFMASYTIPNANAISKVALTVSGYEYGKNVVDAGVIVATENVNIGTPLTWKDGETTVTSGTFGAKAYTVTISDVKAADGCTFADGCLFTVNGYSATYNSTNGTVTCTLPALTAPHTHKYGDWTYLNGAVHYRKCGCGANEMAEHSWAKTSETAATTTAAGSVTYTCSDCREEKLETIPQLTPDPSSGGSSSGGSGSGSVSPSYVITVKDAKNGDVTADRKSASAGTTVTITVKPDSGYVLDDLTVTDARDQTVKLTDKGSGKYTFTMPSSKVTVEASFSKAKDGNPFVDVKPGSYYEDAVIWAVGKGITGGTSATTFDPDAACNRAQAVTFLWRAAGSPAPKSTTMPFTDVPSGSYYYDAVLWAVENGVTNGTSATTFSPSASCNRAQIVTFLWRAQKSPAAAAANPFTDVAADAYYTNAVLWAVKEGVTAGTTATTFSPAADCTRAQIVTFIYRALAE